MPFVQFVKDYQGPITHEVFYAAGVVIDLPGRMSYALRTEGVVEKWAPVEPTTAAVPNPAAVVDVPEPEPKAAKKSARKRATSKKIGKNKAQ